MKNILNFVLFQLGWFASALGAGGMLPYLGPGVIGGILIFHLWKIQPSKYELYLIAIIALIGLLADSL